MSTEARALDARRSAPGPLAGAVLMVRPAAFGANRETAETNRFQTPAGTNSGVRAAARSEFDALAEALERAGVEVMALDDAAEPAKPDAVFPNNWFTTHGDGTVVLYPMLAPSRSLERRGDLVDVLEQRGREVNAVLDLSHWERRGLALEGTGSLILDRRRRIAYACRSPRTAARPLALWAERLGYETHVFDAVDARGVAIYHTNVMMSLGRGFAAVALETLPGDAARARLRESLEAGGNEVIALSHEQVAGFGANILHLEGRGGPVIAMSQTARESLAGEALARLERHGTVVASPIPTIERAGGGSVRCMLAEIFLPRTG